MAVGWQILDQVNVFQVFDWSLKVIGIDHDMVCAGVVATAIRHSMFCAGCRMATCGQAGHHNEYCAG